MKAGRERELSANGRGCLGKAAEEEEVFILRGQDLLAPDLVELWAQRAQAVGCPMPKVIDALSVAERMRRTPNRKNPD